MTEVTVDLGAMDKVQWSVCLLDTSKVLQRDLDSGTFRESPGLLK